MSAIDYLKELKKTQTGKYAQEWLDEAIKALSQEPCEDVVSRTLVLDAVDKWIKCGEWYYSNATDYLFKRMKMLPSVNPIRPKGEWLNARYGIECSKCWTRQIKRLNFCPYCGADMRGGE